MITGAECGRAEPIGDALRFEPVLPMQDDFGTRRANLRQMRQSPIVCAITLYEMDYAHRSRAEWSERLLRLFFSESGELEEMEAAAFDRTGDFAFWFDAASIGYFAYIDARNGVPQPDLGTFESTRDVFDAELIHYRSRIHALVQSSPLLQEIYSQRP